MNKIVVIFSILCVIAPLNAMEENKDANADFISKFDDLDLTDQQATELVRDMIANYKDINARNFTQQTPLIIAAQKGYTKTVEVLLVHMANINAKDIGGQTALMKAAQTGHYKIVEMLIEKGAYSTITTPYILAHNKKNSEGRKTALGFAQEAYKKTSNEDEKERYSNIITLLSKK